MTLTTETPTRVPQRVRVTWRHRVGMPCPAGECRGAAHDRGESLRLFRADLRANPDLACLGCSLDQDCHADIWLSVVNEGAAP